MAKSPRDSKLALEIFGAIAVVLSLVFVGFELRENVRATRAEAAHNVTTALQEWYSGIGTNAEAGAVFRRAMMDPESLTQDEAFQFVMSMHAGMLAYQNSYYLSQEGALDEALNQALTAALSAGRTTPGFEWYWQQRKHFFTAEFQAFVETLNTDQQEAAEIYQ